MVNAKKHKALVNDEETRVNKLQTRYYNELERQGKKRAFLHKHIGKHSIIESQRIDKKRAEIVKNNPEVFLCWELCKQ